MKWSLIITVSKLMAFMVLGTGTAMSIINKDSALMYYTITAVVFLVTGKQIVDIWRKPESKDNKPVNPEDNGK